MEINDNDHVDLHEFRCNSSDFPAMPPRLATDCDDSLMDTTIGSQLLDSSGSTPPPVECLLFPDPENRQAAFNWPGPDPLSPTTQFEDIILYMSAIVPARLLQWVEIRLTELDQITGQTIEEHLFHLFSTKYDKSDPYRVRRYILDLVSVPSNDMPRLFRLNLRT